MGSQVSYRCGMLVLSIEVVTNNRTELQMALNVRKAPAHFPRSSSCSVLPATFTASFAAYLWDQRQPRTYFLPGDTAPRVRSLALSRSVSLSFSSYKGEAELRRVAARLFQRVQPRTLRFSSSPCRPLGRAIARCTTRELGEAPLALVHASALSRRSCQSHTTGGVVARSRPEPNHRQQPATERAALQRREQAVAGPPPRPLGPLARRFGLTSIHGHCLRPAVPARLLILWWAVRICRAHCTWLRARLLRRLCGSRRQHALLPSGGESRRRFRRCRAQPQVQSSRRNSPRRYGAQPTGKHVRARPEQLQTGQLAGGTAPLPEAHRAVRAWSYSCVCVTSTGRPCQYV